MKDMSINQKKVGGRTIEEEFGQALFFVSPTPHYVPRETKIEPDRRLVYSRPLSENKSEIVFRNNFAYIIE